MTNISLVSINKFIQNEKVRIAKASLPFLSLYRPLTRPVSLATQGLHSLSSSAQLLQNVTVKNVIDTSIQVISLASTYFYHPLGQIISTGYDLIREIEKCTQHLQKKEYEKASQSFLHILNSSLYLALYTYGGSQLSIASSLLQIAVALYHARDEFKQRNWIEAGAHGLMALLKTYQCALTTKELFQPISTLERRAVIDVGSGSTKVCIADVDTRTNKVVKIIDKASHPVAYQAALEASDDQTFDPKIRDAGIKTFEKIHEQCQKLGVQKVTTIATEAFRKANNANSFVQEIREKTGINVRVISQKDEAAIAFYSASSLKSEIPEKTLIVWDIGTGSSQITIKKETDVVVAMANMGSVPFKEHILDHKQSTSLHPLTSEDHKDADRFARSIARKAPHEIKIQIKDQQGLVVGVGRLFMNSLAPFAKDKETIQRGDLRQFIRGAVGKTKEEMNDPFSEANVSNATLVLAYMKALHIHSIKPLDAATTQGVLTYEPYW